MKEWILSILTQFTTAANHLFVLPFKLPAHKKLTPALPWFPIVGVLVGTIAFLVAILLRGIFEPLTAAIVMAVLFPAFLYYIVAGRHTISLLKVVKHSGEKETDTPQNELLTILKEHLSLWALLLLVACKAVAVGALVYYGFCSWLIVIPMCSAATYADFLQKAHGLKITPLKSFLPWFIALVLLGAIIGLNGFAVGCVWWFISHQSFSWIAKQEDEFINPFFYSLIEALECVAILAGLCLL